MTQEQQVANAGSRVLHDKVYAEARDRHISDATQSGFEHHLIRVAAEHGARIALSTSPQGTLDEAVELLKPFAHAAFEADGYRDSEAFTIVLRLDDFEGVVPEGGAESLITARQLRDARAFVAKIGTTQQ